MNKMKDTGIPWLPEISADFSIGYVKQYFNVSKDPSKEGEPERVLKLARSGIVEKDVTTNEGQMAASYAGYNKVQIGDLLLNPMDLHSGANCNVSELNGVISPAYSNLRAKKPGSIVPKFYDYYFKSQYWLMAMFAHGKGVSFDNRWTLNNDALRAYEIPVIPYARQQRIVECIQSEERKIDSLIANMQAQIEKLKAYKQSLITEVVTKGLDPTVPMKDSGVEWLGKVPQHWEVYRIANLYAERSESGLPELPLLTVSINTGVSDHEVDDADKGRVFIRMEDRTKYKRVCPGDLTYNMMRAWQGAFGAVRVDGLVSPAYVVAKPKNEIPLDSRYIEALLRTPVAIEEMHRYSRGIIDFRLRLYWPEFKNIQICLPPLDEQTQIADYIDELASKVDSLIGIKQAKIEKLEQYKRSLIYEYVTGKREVN